MESRAGINGMSRLVAVVAIMVLLVAACGSDDGESSDASSETDESSEVSTETDATDDAAAEEPEETETEEQEAEEQGGSDSGDSAAPSTDGVDFTALPAADGEPMVVGFVNTEGPAGLNFPEMRTIAVANIEYLNEHGGMGGRVIELETCIADASPEASQACAQELAGKGVEMVFLALDLAPDYATYEASGIPVVGVLPLFPADYAAEALFLNGGNVTLAAGIVATAVELFEADTVAIVSADNPGANGSEQTLIAALDTAGITYRSIKGSDAETDAGFQGLVREAVSDEPDVLISLYADAGCIGMMRGRAALDSDIPVVAANTCANGEVIEASGDDALGWHFVAGGERPDSVEIKAVKEVAALDLGIEPDEVRLSNLGLGSLPPLMFFGMAAAANELAADGGEITGQSVYDHAKANPSGELRIFPDGGEMDCGASPTYPSVCSFTVFLGTYTGDGNVGIVEGFERFSVLPYLP